MWHRECKHCHRYFERKTRHQRVCSDCKATVKQQRIDKLKTKQIREYEEVINGK